MAVDQEVMSQDSWPSKRAGADIAWGYQKTIPPGSVERKPRSMHRTEVA